MTDDVRARYEVAGVAATYREARALPAKTALLWTDVIRRAVGARAVRTAVDIGAGTGRFTRILADALAVSIVAIERSGGMVDARETSDLATVRYVRGDAEALPLATGSADVVQLSMVYHQLADPAVVVAELARVLRTDGLVLLRTPTQGLLPDFHWVRFFPESLAFDRARIPAHADVVAVFARAGLSLREHSVIHQRIADDLAEYAARVRARAFSSLQALPDDVWERRLAEFEAYCRSAPDGPVDEPVNLFVFEGATRAGETGAGRRTRCAR